MSVRMHLCLSVWFYLWCSFRRGAPSRHEGLGPRGRDSFSAPDDFVAEEKFDSSEETARGRDHSGRGRGRGNPRGKRALLNSLHLVKGSILNSYNDSFKLLTFVYSLGGRKGLLPTPDEFPHFEGGRMDGNREPGKINFH